MNEYKQPYEELYPHLFSPYTIGKTTFKNRIFTAPSCLSHTMSNEGFLTHDGAITYGSRARGGAAVVTLSEAMIDEKTLVAHNDCQVNLIDDKTLRTLNQFTDYVHFFGAKASIELIHCGQWATVIDGKNPIGPSIKTMPPDGAMVDEMTEDDMNYVADCFANGVNMAKRGSFDMVLIHGGHGWLFSQFISPYENKRTDKYGGSIENRARFPLMVLDRIREKVGRDILIEYRFSARELIPGGLEIDEACEFVKLIEDRIDFIQCSVGSHYLRDPLAAVNTMPSHFQPDGANVYLAEAVKKSGVKIPVVAIGAINNPELAERVIAEGKADFVSMVRSFIAEPDWGEKAKAGKSEDIRPCIKCLHCLSTAGPGDGIHSSRKMECAVNPVFGREHLMHYFPPADKHKRVVIVGGGPGGMQAALKAAERGHEVILFEKSGVMGGQLAYTDHVGFKMNLKRYKDYLLRQVEKSGISVRLNTEATLDLVHLERPDAVIVALGAEPLIPPIPGVDGNNVVNAVECYENPNKIGKKVAVVGGGLVGCETALFLAQSDREVVLVEMGDRLGSDGIMFERVHTIHFMDQLLKYFMKMKCTEISDTGIKAVDAKGKLHKFEADTVILSTGMKARSEERDKYRCVAFEVIPVGDCVIAGRLISAVRTGFDAGLRI